MEWIVLLAVIWLAAKYWQKLMPTAPRGIAPRQMAHKRLPTITPDMIEPRDKLLTRQDAAKAYISNHIAALEIEREDTRRRLRIAQRIRRDEENDTETVSEEDYWSAPPYRNEPISETVARRQARFDAQDKAIDALKADVRPLLVDYLNERIRDNGLAQ